MIREIVWGLLALTCFIMFACFASWWALPILLLGALFTLLLVVSA
jgi:hypothetical protein